MLSYPFYNFRIKFLYVAIATGCGLFFYSFNIVFAQTCSCAGAPLLDTQTQSSVSKGNLVLGLTYENNSISDLYSGDNKVDRQNAKRNTQTLLLEANYGLTEKLTLAGTFSMIKKRRESGLDGLQSNILTTSGIGDGIVMLKYVLHQNTIRSQYQIAVGGGTKIPFGASSLRKDNIQLNADMQPGTGAWDGLFWSYFSKTFTPATTVNLFWVNSFRITGSNERFRGSSDGYKFGNEFISTIGAKDKLFKRVSYFAMLRYRSAKSDKLGNHVQPNTGGKWLFAIPGLNFRVNDQILMRLSGSVPIYQYLNGLQPTTSYTVTASLFLNLQGKTMF